MTDQEVYEIIRKAISTGYLIFPKPPITVESAAVVRSLDGSEISVKCQIVGKTASSEEIDAKILYKAHELYEGLSPST